MPSRIRSRAARLAAAPASPPPSPASPPAPGGGRNGQGQPVSCAAAGIASPAASDGNAETDPETLTMNGHKTVGALAERAS